MRLKDLTLRLTSEPNCDFKDFVPWGTRAVVTAQYSPCDIAVFPVVQHPCMNSKTVNTFDIYMKSAVCLLFVVSEVDCGTGEG